jgi:hypothetical protein
LKYMQGEKTEGTTKMIWPQFSFKFREAVGDCFAIHLPVRSVQVLHSWIPPPPPHSRGLNFSKVSCVRGVSQRQICMYSKLKKQFNLIFAILTPGNIRWAVPRYGNNLQGE